ncbi:MAG: family 16 glycosylhydrolase [Bacteroidales bacterium]|nr:family 16 glycosylhydrolase [Bacteroidales bacterium]
MGIFPGTTKVERQRERLISDYQQYKEYSQSEELRRYEYLRKYLNSKEFKKNHSLKQEYDELRKSKALKRYFKKKADENESAYQQYMDEFPSEELRRYEYLRRYLDSEEFKKNNLLKQEYDELRKSKALKHYFKEKANESRFIPATIWKMKFEDDFTDERLNSDIWITRYYRGEKALNENYTLWGDLQCNTDGDNLSIANSILSIETRQEKKKGISWNPLAGFIPCEFPYTSGIVSTAKSFRLRYGKVEAKMKVPGNKAAYHAFWLASEKALPQINIFTYEQGRFYLGNFWGRLNEAGGANRDVTAITGAFAGKSFIFSLEWTKDSLIWAINGVTIKTMLFGIPAEPLYIAMASGVRGKRPLTTPVRFEIDWIRYYQSND